MVCADHQPFPSEPLTHLREVFWQERLSIFSFDKIPMIKKEKEKMEEQKNSKKGLIIGLCVLVLAVIAVCLVFILNRPQTQAGAKTVTIEVVSSDASSKVYEVHTDAEYLRQAMDEADGLTYSGTDSEYGMMVEVVNGESAVYAVDNAYWAFYVNDTYCEYGIDSQPVADGDAFSIVYEAASY